VSGQTGVRGTVQRTAVALLGGRSWRRRGSHGRQDNCCRPGLVARGGRMSIVSLSAVPVDVRGVGELMKIGHSAVGTKGRDGHIEC
jgi:hypothetical protein